MPTLLWLGAGKIARQCLPLLADDWQLAGLSRSAAALEGIAWYQGSADNHRLLALALAAKPDVVVASFTPKEFSDTAYQQSYVEGAKALLRELDGANQKPFVVWISSTSVYGETHGDWVDEQTVPNPQTFSSHRLLEAEELLRASAIEHTCVRFSGIYGSGRERMLDQVREGFYVSKQPVQWSNRIHSEDCAGVIAHLIGRWQSGEKVADRYVASDCEPVEAWQVREWLAQQMAVELTRESPPSRMRANRRCDNRLLLSHGYTFKYPTFREGYGELVSGRE